MCGSFRSEERLGLVAAGWHATGCSLSNVSWSKYTTMYYSFATTTSDVSTLSLEGSDGLLLRDFVLEAHAHRRVVILVYFVQKYDLDRISLDWEYPNHQVIGCNIVSSDDTANFPSFLQGLCKDGMGSNIIVSSSVYLKPFYDSNGNPSTDVSGFAKVLDYMHARPTVLGVAAYGHSYSANSSDAFVGGTRALATHPIFNQSNQSVCDTWNNATDAYDSCAGSGASHYVYSKTSQVMISYGNAESFKAKGAFIKNNGLLCYAMWEAGGDYNSILIDAINGAA
ncbi:glycoside hydrolase [Rhizopogon salebrosus TDB-379]|nr:glycoside hydrolase [Rhizopogon salebrosus TDB-379]